MGKKKHFKKKRQQPRPKTKKKGITSKTKVKNKVTFSIDSQMKAIGEQMMAMLKDKEKLNDTIQKYIDEIEGYFEKYDTIQLLGGVGLY